VPLARSSCCVALLILEESFCVFVAGVLSASALDVVQEKVFSADGINMCIWKQMFYGNLVSLVPYLLTPFLTMLPVLGGRTLSGVWADQTNAFRCLLGTAGVLPPACSDGALMWFSLFVVCYLGSFYTTALLVKKYSAVFQSVVLTIVTPLTTMSFWVPWIVGSQSVEPPKWYIVVSLVIVVCGAMGYRFAKKHQQESVSVKTLPPDEETPLTASVSIA